MQYFKWLYSRHLGNVSSSIKNAPAFLHLGTSKVHKKDIVALLGVQSEQTNITPEALSLPNSSQLPSPSDLGARLTICRVGQVRQRFAGVLSKVETCKLNWRDPEVLQRDTLPPIADDPIDRADQTMRCDQFI